MDTDIRSSNRDRDITKRNRRILKNFVFVFGGRESDTSFIIAKKLDGRYFIRIKGT